MMLIESYETFFKYYIQERPLKIIPPPEEAFAF
jgi:hypothetical protein